MYHKLEKKFKEVFGQTAPIHNFFAPGRVNLIGEHIDYNGGSVLPAAIELGTYAIVSIREDEEIHFYSENMSDNKKVIKNLSNLEFDEKDGWANYPKGVLYYLQKQGYRFAHGLNILYYGEIPNGAGLSSSASIELLTALIVKNIYNLNVTMKENVLLGQKVENEYLGVNSGIMDQFSIGFGKKDHAILLDCNTLEYKYVPIQLREAKLIIINTNKKRKLTHSKYNERREECNQALSDLQKKLDIKHLTDLSPLELEKHKSLITSEKNRARAKHVVEENARTKKAYQYLKNDQIEEFGELMYESHESLKHLYEVTGKELDTIIQISKKEKGVLGARMTGAGFGGCAIALVNNEEVDKYIESMTTKYKEEIGYFPEIYITKVSDGPKFIK